MSRVCAPQNILFKNILSPTIAAILFWGFGYSIAYGNDCDANTSGGFMGSRCYYVHADGAQSLIYKTADGDGNPIALPTATGDDYVGVNGGIVDPLGNCTTHPDQAACPNGHGMSGYVGKWYAIWFFQWAFCATASTIVSGGADPPLFALVPCTPNFFDAHGCVCFADCVHGRVTAVAERVSFKVYIIITIFLTGFIYP
eukprot:COSAG01_NODE_21834_length_882_cov_7.729246_2_plen_199_part_00